ncbi:MAG TPA: cell division topological specificity factor MinE [Candidatus Eremiobacteraceae bacterium]|nr:cell division topological specificity factor MinE [Candidatus Eremiobacteraceae bacterium]
MLDFITRFFKREEASKTLAKERLRLVLMSDRVSLAPDIFDEMKGEMLAVIRRYLEIDERALDMHFENLERQFALLANIPVLKVRSAEEIKASPAIGVGAHIFNGASVANGSSPLNGMSAIAETPRSTASGRRRRRRRTTRASGTSGSSETNGAADTNGATGTNGSISSNGTSHLPEDDAPSDPGAGPDGLI